MLLVVAALAPAMLLIFYMATQYYERTRLQVQEAALRLAHVVGTDHARQVSAARRILLALAEMEEVRHSDSRGCASGPPYLISPESDFIDLQLIDATGNRLCTWSAGTHPVSAAESALARQAIEAGHFVVGGYEFDARAGRSEAHFAYPRTPSHGQTSAALVLSYDLSRIGDLIRGSGLPEHASVAIMNSDGELLYGFQKTEQSAGNQIAYMPHGHGGHDRKQAGVDEVEGFDGPPRLFAFAPLQLRESGEAFHVHVGIPSAIAYRNNTLTLAAALGGLGVVSMIVLALAWFGGNALIGRPIGALIAAVKRLGGGDYAARSGLGHLAGEIGQLATGFDGMAKALQQRHFEVEQLRFAIDEHAIVSITGLDGKISFVNDKFVEISQYTREELLGQDHRILNSGYHDKAFFAELWRTIAGGLPWQGVIRNRSNDGNFHWLATTIIPVLGTDGRHHYYLSIRTDVTQIKQMEESLRRSEAKFRGLADTMSSAVVVQREGKTLYANRYAETLTGFSSDELLTMDLLEIAHPESRLLIRDRGEARIAGKPVSPRFEFRLNTKEGQERWVEMSGGVVNFDGQTCLLGTFTDITERHAAQAALRHAHGELEQLVEKRTEQLSAAKRDLERDVARRKQAEAELIERNTELTALNQRLSDAQNQLMQSEKLASVGQLAAGVAHEINNPIGYVHSNLGALENYLGDLFKLMDGYRGAEAAMQPDHAAVQALQRLKSSVDLDFLRQDLPALMNESKEGITRVRKIVQDLKDFSRIDSALEWQWSNLHQGLDSTLNIVASEIKYRADVNKHYGSIPDIECLPSQLNQVFMNLLVNAAHAIQGERGTITLSTGQEGESVWVEFADTGSGIAKENLSRVFDPFFTTKPVGKGTGLGLSLSYGIVQKHNGRIEVTSEPGEGTTFRVILPIQQIERLSATQSGQAAEPAKAAAELIA